MKNGTGADLIRFWEWVAEKGLVKQSTAGARRTAVTEVLDSLGDDPAEVDIQTLDVDDALRRFENLKSAKYTPGSLKTYKSRFTHAVDEYLTYLDDPSSWRPDIQTRKTRSQKKAEQPKKIEASGKTSPSESEGSAVQPSWPGGSRLIEYPFPVREGVVAVLRLPTDLTAGEARRLGAWLQALALPDEPPIDGSG